VINRAMVRTLALWGAALASPFAAHAHHAMGNSTPANAFEGLLSGLAHPVIGIDHLLFVVAVGIACYYFGNRRASPAAFIAGTLAGTALHLQLTTLAYPDAWVAASLLVLGILLLVRSRFLQSKAAVAAFGLSGVAHGYAYGESIVGAESTPLFAYLAGFTIVQLVTVLAVYGLARYAARIRPSSQAVSACGGVLTVAGAAFLLLSVNG